MTRMMPRVMAASAMFEMEPKSADPAPPAAQRMATGSSEMPMTVITDPVTTGGKKCSRRANTPDSRNPARPAIRTEPKMARRPSTPPPAEAPTAIIEATAANEVPCTIGSFAPIQGTPRVCSRVARPDTSRVAASRYDRSAKGSLSVLPTMNGTATTPAYMLITCCRPYRTIGPGLRTSSTGCVPSGSRATPSCPEKFSAGCSECAIRTTSPGPGRRPVPGRVRRRCGWCPR